MMATIQKRADELKPGDVLPAQSGVCSTPVVIVKPSGISGDFIYFYMVYVRDAAPVAVEGKFDPAHIIEVEAPDLTTAQQHADEMAAWMVRNEPAFRLGRPISTDDERAALTIIVKIRPPEPPTLAEALEAIAEYMGDPDSPKLHAEQVTAATRVRELLDRARRARVWK